MSNRCKRGLAAWVLAVEATINVPVVIVVFVLFLGSQTLLMFGLLDPAEIDAFILRELEAEIAPNRGDGPCFFLVMLDSAHVDYCWGKDFQPRFLPYMERVPVVPCPV